MRPVVRSAFPKFTEVFEGHCSFMYCDILGLVTTGRGNLIDPIAPALALPWKKPDGTPATQAEIAAEWNRIKALQSIRNRGGFAYKPYATLFLDEAAIDALTLAKMDEMWGFLLKRYTDLETWPADAQVGLLSMSWAMGPAFKFPSFDAYAKVRDFSGMASQCTMNATGNPGLIPRNKANVTLFENAHEVYVLPLDPETLFYPSIVNPYSA